METQAIWNSLIRDSEWASLFVGTERQLDNFVLRRPRGQGIVARIVRARRGGVETDVYQEWAAALQFPYYFGYNGPAFAECVGDLSWLEGSVQIVFIAQTKYVCLEYLVPTLSYVNPDRLEAHERDPSRKFIPFRAVFHCESQDMGVTQDLLKKAGLDDVPPAVRLPSELL